VVGGEKLGELRRALTEASSLPGEPAPDLPYPRFTEPYLSRRRHLGMKVFEAKGIPREDTEKRRQWGLTGVRLFEAPNAIFLFMDRSLDSGWSLIDTGLVTMAETPYEGIVEAAKKQKCDAIFMASHSYMKAPASDPANSASRKPPRPPARDTIASMSVWHVADFVSSDSFALIVLLSISISMPLFPRRGSFALLHSMCSFYRHSVAMQSFFALIFNIFSLNKFNHLSYCCA